MKPEIERNADLPVTLRPDWFAFAFFGGLTLLVWLPGIAEMYRGLSHGPRDLAMGVSASILIFLLLYFWNIEIGQEGIAYRKLLFRKIFMPYSSIKEARIETSLFRSRTRRRPVYCLLLIPKSENAPPLMINIKPFSRRGLSLLIQTISDKAPQVQLDTACERMKNKIMPSVFFQENGSSDRSDCANAR